MSKSKKRTTKATKNTKGTKKMGRRLKTEGRAAEPVADVMKPRRIMTKAEYEAGIETTAQDAATGGDVGPRSANAGKPGNRTGPRKSLVAAAICVLAESPEAMNAKAIVAEATAKGWYTQGTGKTPHATLYSAMLRDAREPDARFRKSARGTWELTVIGHAVAGKIKDALAA